MKRVVAVMLLAGIVAALCNVALYAKEDVTAPKEYGVYIKTPKGMKRLLPNVIFDEKGILYLESNNPPRFSLADVEQFIVYGKYEIKYLTLNPMLFVNETPLGKSRYLFGKEIELDVVKKGDLLYTAKTKGLFGRGYYSLWINDSAWDFVIE